MNDGVVLSSGEGASQELWIGVDGQSGNNPGDDGDEEDDEQAEDGADRNVAKKSGKKKSPIDGVEAQNADEAHLFPKPRTFQTSTNKHQPSKVVIDHHAERKTSWVSPVESDEEAPESGPASGNQLQDDSEDEEQQPERQPTKQSRRKGQQNAGAKRGSNPQ